MRGRSVVGLAGAVLCLVGAGSALAQGSVGTIPVEGEAAPAGAMSALSYTYVEAGYALTDFEGTSIGQDGFVVRGGYLLTQDIFLVGAYRMEETDDLGDIGVNGTVKISTGELGVGYRLGLSADADFNAGLDVIQENQKGTGDLSGQKDNNTGYRLRLGLRDMLLSNLEVSGSGAIVSLNHDRQSVVTVGALYEPIAHIGVGADIAVGGDSTTYTARVRYRF